MATWSSFEKDKLITEGWRDFFKKKKESAGTYPASELTTIVNLISNLAKKLKIDIDISKIVDEFETILKSQNYNLQEQEDKIMIGGDVNLDLSKAPTLKTFMDAVAAQNPEGLKILLKALGRGAFDVSKYKPAASTEQTSIEEPEQATPATVETDFPIQITVDEFSKFIDESNFETIKKMFNKLGVNKETEEIKQKFKSLLLPLFKSFDKALKGSDVGKYFRLQTQVKETINIEDRLGNYSNPQSNLYIFLFGALLKNYIQKRSNEVEGIVGDLPDQVLTQLQNSVSGLTNKTLRSILGSKRDAGKPTAEPPSASDKKEPEAESNFDGETGVPITQKGRDLIINQIAKTNSADEFFDLYDKLAKSNFSNDKDSFAKAVKDSDHLKISGFGTNNAWRTVIRQKFINLVIKDKLLEKLTETDSAEEFKEIYNALHGANPKRNSFDKIMSIAKDDPQEALKYISIFGGDEKYREPIKDNFKKLFLNDKTQEEPVATEPTEPEPASPEPEANQEPASEPQATEEPLKIITKILGEKGVSEERVNAFIDDLKNMGVIQEIASRTLQRSLKMNMAEWGEFSQKHKEVIEAIRQLGGRSKEAIALRKQFKDALSKIITRTNIPRPKRGSKKKKSADRPASKSEPTPAAATPTEPEPEAASPEPEVNQETAPEQQPEEEKQLDISQIEKNVLEAWRGYYNKDLEEPVSVYSPGMIQRKMEKVEGVIDAKNIEEGVMVRFADIRNSKDEPYNAFVVPKRKNEKIYNIEKYYNISNKDQASEQVRVKDIKELAKYILYDINSVTHGKGLDKGVLEIVGSENSEAPQPQSKPKKEMPPIKDQEAYDHGKQGKAMNAKGVFIDRTVQSIEKAIDGLSKVKANSDNEELRNKIDSYIRGLDEYEPPTKLEESLMLRWKTIAGIK
jgi:hypothetical protein